MHTSPSTVRILVAAGTGATIVLLSALAGAIEQETAPVAPPVENNSANAGLAPVGMKLVPGGKAVIGLNADEIKTINHKENPEWLNLLASTQPRHEVQLESFYLDVCEITNQQWKTYLDLTKLEPSKDLVLNYWKDGKIPAGHEQRPVIYVSYDDVMGYCRWAHRRLPTEYEWEYAARGPTGNQYPWGATFDVGDKRGGALAVCDATKFGKDEPRGTLPVGGRKDGASVFGIEDLAGNVWEWTSSRFVAYPGYTDFIVPTKRGKEGEHFVAPFNNMEYVIRGGAFNLGKTALMSALRQNAPAQQWWDAVGFRTAKSATPGVDAIKNSIPVLASYNAANDLLDFSSTVAIERDLVDAEGRFMGVRGFALAPTQRIPKLRTVLEPGSSTTIAVMVMTEPSLVPPLPPGIYTVKVFAKNPKEKPLYSPDDLWVHHGSGHMERAVEAMEKAKKEAARLAEEERKKAEAEAKKAAREAKKKKPAKKDDAKEGDGPPPVDPGAGGVVVPPESGGAPAAPEAAPAEIEPTLALPEGSVQFDKSRNHIVIWSQRGSVVAAYPLKEDVADSAKPMKLTMTKESVAAGPVEKASAEELPVDKKAPPAKKAPPKKAPAGKPEPAPEPAQMRKAADRLTFKVAIESELKGRAISFEFPIDFEPGRIDSPTPPKLPETAASATTK